MSGQNQRQPGPVAFGRLSVWRDSGRLDDREAREHAARLEIRAGAESEIAARDEYVRLLGVAPGERVLDVGCGSGAVTRASDVEAAWRRGIARVWRRLLR